MRTPYRQFALLLPLLCACSIGSPLADVHDDAGQDAFDDTAGEIRDDAREDTGDDNGGEVTLPDAVPYIENPNLLGSFKVIEQTSIWEEETHHGAGAWGGFYLTPMPPHLTAAAGEGACTLYLYDTDRCPGPNGDGCLYDSICTTDGTCAAWPQTGSVGAISISGLSGIADQVIQPQYGSYYSVAMPNPQPTDIFDASSTIRIAAPGNVIPGIDLTVRGVKGLEVDESDYLNVPMGDQDTLLRWTRGDPGDRIQLTIPAVNECHGCPPLGKIVCDAPDTGALVVPGSLLSRMPRVMAGMCVGIDCPNATLERYRSELAHLEPGDIELRVSSLVSFRIEHPEPVEIPTAFLISANESRTKSSEQTSWVSVSNPPAEEMTPVEKARVGGCSFLEPEEPGICETFCSWPGYCGSDNQCHEGLPRRWAGEIQFTGLLEECRVPIAGLDGSYPYYLGECDPLYPPDLFAEGALISATASGGDDLPAFSLSVPGVRQIETDLPCDTFSLEAGKSLTVEWTPGGQPGDRIQFFLRSANHGGQFGHIDCDVPDTGTLTVDSSLIDLHLAAFNPAPSWMLVRRHAARSTVDGTGIEFEVSSQIGCMYTIP